MEISNSPLGIKRNLEVVGFLEWNNIEKFLIAQYYIRAIDAKDTLLTDKVINQNREVRYVLNNINRVDNQFNPVETGGKGEYDFFINLIKTSPLPTVLNQLSVKLNERGIFD